VDGTRSNRSGATASGLYALALILSAALLFSMQPMVARMALPTLGGTPSVWNTCMVFFQAAVLGGYALAHLLATRCSHRTQILVFVGWIGIGFSTLPIRLVSPGMVPTESPAVWLLGRLLIEAGLPALVLATASPLLQRWFNRIDGRDPYFLYAASNLGSLGALIAYPAWIEPALALDAQAGFWRWGFLAWAAGVIGITFLRRSAGRRPDPEIISEPHPAPDRLRWLAWIGLGAVPASLLQGCTLFLTTDLASIPLLWVIPLGLYLLTFILVFDVRSRAPVRIARLLLPYLATALLFAILTRATQPVLLLIALHLGFLLAAGLVCHGRLVELRPDAAHLTRFYLALSLGGVAGGAFNALLAPHLFHSIVEYPIAIALACAALSGRKSISPDTRTARAWATDIAIAAGIGLGIVAIALPTHHLLQGQERLRDNLVFGIVAVICWTLLDRPRRLALGLLAAFTIGLGLQSHWADHQFAQRNFFGVTRVTRDPEGRFHQLVHGNTFHGRQHRDPVHRNEPLTYYHRNGPVGRVFETFRSLRPGNPGAQLGMIGLGVGSLAAYGIPGDAITFFEIDPAVIQVARDPRWFSFLADCPAGPPRIVEGDARLKLAQEPEGGFDLLVLDAFSSDAIPMHLLTREALALYRGKLKPAGWLVIHLSNRYLDLAPVIGALAKDAGIACRGYEDDDPSEPGQEASHWMVLARDEAALGTLARAAPWMPPATPARFPVWTDQRAAIWPVFQW
jgi:hypothetical protein